MANELVVLVASQDFVDSNEGNPALARAARRLDVQLKPAHKDVNDEELRRYFVAIVEDSQVAEQMAREFRAMKEVEAAYVKPPADLPNM